MNGKLTKRNWFYSQPTSAVPDCAEHEAFKVYRLDCTGQYIIETEIDSGLGGETVEIDQITDIHFNYVSIADEDDAEVMGTREKRVWLREGEAVASAIRAMDVAAYADQTVITGDTLDFLSMGSIMLTKKHILDRDPEVLMTLGGHELTKQMQTGKPNLTSVEERLAILGEFWPHDMFYYSRDVKEKVICVCLDNSRGRFHGCQPERLAADIERARAERKIILIFMHEPIAPRDGKGVVPALWYSIGSHNEYDLDQNSVIGGGEMDMATAETYRLITENADVVKGLFCGHLHSMFYNEVKASYTDGDGTHDAVIPQLIAPGNAYLNHAGRVVRIIVK